MAGQLTRLAALIAASGAVWMLSGALPSAARAWAVFLLILLPTFAVAQAKMLTSIGEITTESIYTSTIVSLWVLAAVTAIIAWAPDSPTLRFPGPTVTIAWAAGATLAGILVVILGHAFGIREVPFLHKLLPATNRHRVMFVALSITAGFCEEFVFRGFLLGALEHITGYAALAALISSAAFGVVHAYQSRAGAARAAILGAILALPVLATGTLVPSMIAHAAIDLLGGFWLRDRLVR